MTIRWTLLGSALFSTCIIFLLAPTKVEWEKPFQRSLAPLRAADTSLVQGPLIASATPLAPVPLDLEDGLQKFVTEGKEKTRITTPWYPFERSIIILVSGYPGRRDVTLTAEIGTPGGPTTSVPFAGQHDSALVWEAWKLSFPGNVSRMRIVAVDEATDEKGWLGFSLPYYHSNLEAWAKIAAIFTVSFAIFLGSGLALRVVFLRRHQALGFEWMSVPATLLLCVIGMAIWLRPPGFSASAFSKVSLIGWMWVLVAHEFCTGWDKFITSQEKTLLGLALVVGLAALSRGIYSQGPSHELYLDSISRSTEVGWTSDSRISYHNAQVTLNGWSRKDPRTAFLFSPFDFTSRGPILGWIAAPFMALFSQYIPEKHPDQKFEPFDPFGFMSFRIVAGCLSSLVLFAAFGVLTHFTTAQGALQTCIALATCPFLIHETFFTWPKLGATTFILISFLCATKGQMMVCGLIIGLAYLIHPMTLLFMPFIGVWRFALNQKKENGLFRVAMRTLLKDGFPYVLGIAIFYIPWYLANQSQLSQGMFFNYIFEADGRRAQSLGHWLKFRMASLCNTLIPFYQFLFWGHDWRLHSPGGRSPAIVRWAWQYWSTLPFALGLTGFPFVYARFTAMVRAFRGAFWLTIGAPFLLLWICFGSESNGLVRNSAQPIFVALVLMFGLFAAKDEKTTLLMKKFPLLIRLRSAELFFLLFGASLLSSSRLYSPAYWDSDLIALLVGLSACAAFLPIANRAKNLAH